MEPWLIIPNFKIPIGESNYEEIFLVSGMCCRDGIQFIFRISQEKGYSYAEEKICQICGEPLICFSDKNYIDCGFSEVVACLVEQKNVLSLVISDTFYSQIKDVLLATLDRHDFSQSYREIKILQSGNLSRQIIGKPTKNLLLQGTRLQKYYTSETWPDTSKKSATRQQKDDQQPKEKQEKSDKKKNSSKIWRLKIANSAKQLLKKLKKDEKEEKLVRQKSAHHLKSSKQSVQPPSSITPTKWQGGSSQSAEAFFQAKHIVPKHLLTPLSGQPLVPKAKKRISKKEP